MSKPESSFQCPKCGSSWWGTDATVTPWIGHCAKCRFRWERTKEADQALGIDPPRVTEPMAASAVEERDQLRARVAELKAALHASKEDYDSLEFYAARVVREHDMNPPLDRSSLRYAIDRLVGSGRDGWVGQALADGEERGDHQ